MSFVHLWIEFPSPDFNGILSWLSCSVVKLSLYSAGFPNSEINPRTRREWSWLSQLSSLTYTILYQTKSPFTFNQIQTHGYHVKDKTNSFLRMKPSQQCWCLLWFSPILPAEKEKKETFEWSNQRVMLSLFKVYLVQISSVILLNSFSSPLLSSVSHLFTLHCSLCLNSQAN